MSLTRAVKLAFQRLAPLELAESWDNVGLLLEPFASGVASSGARNKVLLATDLTRQIVDDMPDDVGSIVVYHPAIFRGLKSLTQDDALQACILKCAAKGISIYSPHTSLDAASGGIQDWLARGLGDGQWQSHPQRPRVWELSSPLDLQEAVERIKKHLGMSTDELDICRRGSCLMQFCATQADTFGCVALGPPALMLARSLTGEKSIKTIGLCAGSGASFLQGSKADLWWTGEMSHHEVLATVASGTHVVLCTHTATERPYLKSYFRAKLEEALNEVRREEKLADEPYSVIMSDHEVEVLQFV